MLRINSKDTIIICNQHTYEKFEDAAHKKASSLPDPLEYIHYWTGYKVIIDNSLPDNITELWNEKSYYEYKTYEKYKDED